MIYCEDKHSEEVDNTCAACKQSSDGNNTVKVIYSSDATNCYL